MRKWFTDRSEKYKILVAELNSQVVGWVALNPYSHRCAYRGIADLSIYMRRNQRGKGIGKALLSHIEKEAVKSQIHKIVLFTFPFNELGQGLYKSMGYREAGTFKEHGNSFLQERGILCF